MDLRHLRYFVAVAEELSFTRAAERLHMAQPPLSTQIRALEEELGAALFIRDKRRVFLTQAGHELLGRARAVLGAAEEAKAATRHAAAGRTGRVALGYTASSMFTERLPAVLRRFTASHPQIELVLHEMTSLEQLEAIDARSLDVGILRKPDVAAPKGVAIEPWYVAPLVAALPKDHPLVAKRALRIADLDAEPLITYPRDAGVGLYWPVLQLFTRSGARPRIVREALEPALMIGLVSAGIGIAIVPADTCCIQLEGVAYRPLSDPSAVSTLSLAHREGEAVESVRQMIVAIRARSALRPPRTRRQAAGSKSA
jgi:DNA-binding transcriptional LysR family regulator